ncbi:molybdopterin converting factor small subunit [Sedimentibacter acidaminivorans]|uniref:Molybdopterin converting factor small subunit n=1 Tax=Sedimentibacter acidaminivorans TaxID=913099 RepID=A0ABS4GEQ6_9FIRM|nr:MoaD/ThiS family protein [Sedimentibacter acidaminivorans]MBP1926180.1 molybdopterin converting factor small subunit [Sedimentibacter acidaminivorans]
MDIEVRLFASFRDNRWKSKHLIINKGTTIRKIIEQIYINEKDLGIVLINGRHSNIDSVLENNDILALFPPVGGG